MTKKTTISIELKDLEDIISKYFQIELKVESFGIKTEGDYDKGNYRETLTKITFISEN